ncbi:MAG: 50S ribosomal protein L24 [Gammaproteobacteria bacterium]
MATKIKKGDTVVVISGKEKGKRGQILKKTKTDYVLVEGLNLVRKHQKGNPQRQIESGILEKEAPIHISNVAIYNSTTKSKDRVGFKFLEDGQKVRCFKSSKEVIDL